MSKEIQYERTFDPFARLVSIGVLLMAGAALFFVWQERQNVPNASDIAPRLVTEYKSALQKIDELHENELLASEKRQSDFEDELVRFRDSTDAALIVAAKPIERTPSDSASDENEWDGSTVRDLVTDPPAETTGAEDVTTANNGIGASAVATEEGDDPDIDVEIGGIPRAELTSSASGSSSILELRNIGERDAMIEAITFTPLEVVKLDPAEFSQELLPAKLATIPFDPEHNLTEETGRHGIYHQEMVDTFPWVLAADDDTRVLLTAVNPKHAGWGLIGDLKIRYNSDKELTIKAATIVFTED